LPAVLRGSVGCDFTGILRLSASEREACRGRLAKGRILDADSAIPAINPKAKAAFDESAQRAEIISQPFLAERPKNGCRPMVVHQELAAPGGSRSQQDWKTAIACGKTF
jgi:hypothetical protein